MNYTHLLLTLWRLSWHFLNHITIHRGKEFHPAAKSSERQNTTNKHVSALLMWYHPSAQKTVLFNLIQMIMD